MLKDSRVPLAWERVIDVWSALLDNPDACADDRTVSWLRWDFDHRAESVAIICLAQYVVAVWCRDFCIMLQESLASGYIWTKLMLSSVTHYAVAVLPFYVAYTVFHSSGIVPADCCRCR